MHHPSNGLLSSPNCFPLGVWFEAVIEQAHVDLDKDAGLDLYAVLTANSNLSLIEANDMRQSSSNGNSAPNRRRSAVAPLSAEMAKFHASSKENGASTPAFLLAGIATGPDTALDEDRTIPISNGRFSDHFLPMANAVHNLYDR